MECMLTMLAGDNNLEETVYMPEDRATVQKDLGKLERQGNRSLVNLTWKNAKFFTLEGVTPCNNTDWDWLAEKCLC